MLIMVCDIDRVPHSDVDNFIFRYHTDHEDDDEYKCIIQYIQYNEAYKPSVGELIVVAKQMYKVISVIFNYQEDGLFVMAKRCNQYGI